MRGSPLLPIFLIVAVDVLGYTIILPLLPFYAERMGATPFVVGLLISSYAFCQLIAGPILGRLSDQFGRRPLLLVSQVGTLAGFLMLAAATTLPIVFLSRIIDGLTAGNLSLAQAYIADVTRPEERSKAFGLIGIAFGAGFLIGPAISGILSQFGYAYPVLAAALLSATSITATYFLLPANPPRPEGVTAGPPARRLSILDWDRYGEYFRRRELAPLLAKYFSYVFSFGIFTAGFALFCERRYFWNGRPFGPREVGYAYAFSGLLGGILQGGLLGRLVKRFGEVPLMAVGFLSVVAGYVSLGFSHTILSLGIVIAVSALGGVVRPIVTSLITQASGRHEQGTVLGLTQSLMSLGQIVAPLLAGALIDHQLLTAWALTSAAVAALGAAVRTPPPATPADK